MLAQVLKQHNTQWEQFNYEKYGTLPPTIALKGGDIYQFLSELSPDILMEEVNEEITLLDVREYIHCVDLAI